MKNWIRKDWRLLAVLLTAAVFTAPATSKDTTSQQHKKSQESLKFFPHTYDEIPELPSPHTTADGIEIILAFTKENKWTIVPVTVAKGESLGYRERDWDNIRILKVDGEDFPTLARTGLHSEIELDSTRRITGRSIAEITDAGRPGDSSGVGFMDSEEDIISVLKGDNRFVKKLGLTHPQLAKPLFHVWNMIRWVNHTRKRVGRSIDDITYFLYNQRKIHLLHAGGRGWQESIFNDEILGMYQIEFRSELDESEKAFLHEQYPDLSDQQMADLLKMLSHIYTGEMVPFYIMRYGFYEGHSGYRSDPIALSFIFGLKNLEEIETAFAGILDKVLSEFFSRENATAKEGGCHE